MQELATSNSPCLSQPDQFATILLHLSRQVTPDPEVVRSGTAIWDTAASALARSSPPAATWATRRTPTPTPRAITATATTRTGPGAASSIEARRLLLIGRPPVHCEAAEGPGGVRRALPGGFDQLRGGLPSDGIAQADSLRARSWSIQVPTPIPTDGSLPP
jgi:hypothetical protein